jgi:DNA polymerase-3 subunit beta
MALAATDRYRLAMRELGWSAARRDIRVTILIPARTLAEAARMMAAGVSVQVMLRGDAAVSPPAGSATGSSGTGTGTGAGPWPVLAGTAPGSLRAADAMIGFECGGRRLTTRLIAGEFIKYKSRFPGEFGCCGDMPAAPLAEAVKRVALVAERGSSVRLSFGPGKVTIEAGSEGQARAREIVAAEFEGDEHAIAFSPGYLLDGLSAALTAAATAAPPAGDDGADGNDHADGTDHAGGGEARIRLQFTGPTKPAVITGTKRAGTKPDFAESAPDFRYLVVPLRALTSA